MSSLNTKTYPTKARYLPFVVNTLFTWHCAEKLVLRRSCPLYIDYEHWTAKSVLLSLHWTVKFVLLSLRTFYTDYEHWAAKFVFRCSRPLYTDYAHWTAKFVLRSSIPFYMHYEHWKTKFVLRSSCHLLHGIWALDSINSATVCENRLVTLLSTNIPWNSITVHVTTAHLNADSSNRANSKTAHVY